MIRRASSRVSNFPRDRFGLLRARRKRPCGCGSADERDQLASLHGIRAAETVPT